MPKRITEWINKVSGQDQVIRASRSMGSEGERAQDRWSKGIAETNRRLSTLDATSSRLQKGLGGLIRQGAAFSAGFLGGQALIRGIRGVTNAIFDFEDEFARVNTLLTNESPAAIERLRRELIDLPVQFGSLEDSARAAYQAISTGTDISNVAKLIPEAAILAKGGFVELASATNALNKVLNTYGLEASQAREVSNVFFGTLKEGDVTIDQIIQQMGRLLPAAKALNIPFSEVGAAVATLTSQSFTAEGAFTGLVGIFSQFIQNEPAFRKAGIDIIDVVGRRGIAGAMEELERITGGGITATQKFIRSDEGLRAALSLTGAGLDTFNEKLGRITADPNAGLKAFEAATNTTRTRLNDLGEEFKRLTHEASPFFELVTGIGISALKLLADQLKGLKDGLGVSTPNAQALREEIERLEERLKRFQEGGVDSFFLNLLRPQEADRLLQRIEELRKQLTLLRREAQPRGSEFPFAQMADQAGEAAREITALTVTQVSELNAFIDRASRVGLSDKDVQIQVVTEQAERLRQALINAKQPTDELDAAVKRIVDDIKSGGVSLGDLNKRVAEFANETRDVNLTPLERDLAKLRDRYEDIKKDAMLAKRPIDDLNASFEQQQQVLRDNAFREAQNEIREFRRAVEDVDLTPFQRDLGEVKEEYEALKNTISDPQLLNELEEAFEFSKAQVAKERVADLNEEVAALYRQATGSGATETERRLEALAVQFTGLFNRAVELKQPLGDIVQLYRDLAENIINEDAERKAREHLDDIARKRDEILSRGADAIADQFGDSFFNVLTGRFEEGAQDLLDVFRDVFVRGVSELFKTALFEPEVFRSLFSQATQSGSFGSPRGSDLGTVSALAQAGGSAGAQGGGFFASVPGLLAGLAGGKPGAGLGSLTLGGGLRAGAFGIGVGQTAAGLFNQFGLGGRAGAGLGGALGGLTTGAAIGSLAGPFGTVVGGGIGALIGGIGGALFGGGKKDTDLEASLISFSRQQRRPASFFEDNQFRNTPISQIGIRGDRINASQLLDQIERVDEAIAEFVTDRQLEIIKNLRGIRNRGSDKIIVDEGEVDALLGGLVLDRLKTVIEGLSGSRAIADRTFAGLGDAPSADAAIKAFDRVAAVFRQLEEIRFPEDDITQSALAIETINKRFQELIDTAEDVGAPLRDVQALIRERKRQISEVARGFNIEVQRQIDAIRQPILLAADDILAEIEERRKEAVGAGADLALVGQLASAQQLQFLEQQLEIGKTIGTGADDLGEATKQVREHFEQLLEASRRFGQGTETVQAAYDQALEALQATPEAATGAANALVDAVQRFIDAGSGLTPLGNQLERLKMSYLELVATARANDIFDELRQSFINQRNALRQPFFTDVRARELDLSAPKGAAVFRLRLAQQEELKAAIELEFNETFLRRLRKLHDDELAALVQSQREATTALNVQRQSFLNEIRARETELVNPDSAARFRLHLTQQEEIKAAIELGFNQTFLRRLRALHDDEMAALIESQREVVEAAQDIDTSTIEDAVMAFRRAANPLTSAAEAVRLLREEAEDLAQSAREAGVSTAGITTSLSAQIAAISGNELDALRLDLLRFTDPLQAALTELDTEQRERLRTFRELGLETVELERLFALQRQEVLEQFAERAAQTTEITTRTLDDFLRQQTGSVASAFVTEGTLARARRNFQESLQAQDQQLVAQAGQNLIDLATRFFGTGAEARGIFDTVIGSVSDLRDRIGAGQAVTTVAVSGTVATVADETSMQLFGDISLELSVQTGVLREIRREVATLNRRMDTFMREQSLVNA